MVPDTLGKWGVGIGGERGKGRGGAYKQRITYHIGGGGRGDRGSRGRRGARQGEGRGGGGMAGRGMGEGDGDA